MSDDLYDDIADTKPASVGSKKPPAASSNGRPLSLTDEVQVLRQHVQRLEQENKNLKRNMGTLYRTAVAELKRKDAQIAALNDCS